MLKHYVAAVTQVYAPCSFTLPKSEDHQRDSSQQNVCASTLSHSPTGTGIKVGAFLLPVIFITWGTVILCI